MVIKIFASIHNRSYKFSKYTVDQCCGAGAGAAAARSRIIWSEPEP
jgi:hypothetical protein